jgi:hypothetical protein
VSPTLQLNWSHAQFVPVDLNIWRENATWLLIGRKTVPFKKTKLFTRSLNHGIFYGIYIPRNISPCKRALSFFWKCQTLCFCHVPMSIPDTDHDVLPRLVWIHPLIDTVQNLIENENLVQVESDPHRVAEQEDENNT